MKRKVSPVIHLLLVASFLSLRTSAYRRPIPYISNGDFTTDDEFPFMVALGWENNATEKIDYLCGGMLIAPNFVLTAAHCVLKNRKLPDAVKIGGNSLDRTWLNEIHYIKDFFIYPEYDKQEAYYDIALLQLAENSGKPPVCIWTRPTLYTKNVTAIGYGATGFAGAKTTSLLKVDLIVFPEKICRRYFKRKRNFPTGIRHSHLCAGDPEGRKDTCQGDSGGPLLVEYRHQTYAAGITSTGQACSGFPPAVYTRISSFIGWIEEVVREYGYSIRKTCGISESV